MNGLSPYPHIGLDAVVERMTLPDRHEGFRRGQLRPDRAIHQHRKRRFRPLEHDKVGVCGGRRVFELEQALGVQDRDGLASEVQKTLEDRRYSRGTREQGDGKDFPDRLRTDAERFFGDFKNEYAC